MKRLLLIFVIISISTSVGSAFDETHKDTEHLIQAATIVFEDPTKNFTDSKEDKNNNKEDEEQISVFNKLKTDITTFSKKNDINEFYIFPFLAGLFLGPLAIAGAYTFSYNHPQRKTRVRTVFVGWAWWLVIFSIILLV